MFIALDKLHNQGVNHSGGTGKADWIELQR